MAASYPSSVIAAINVADNVDTVFASHVNNLYTEVIAIETALEQTYLIVDPIHTGPRLNNNSGVLEVKNNAGSAYAGLTVSALTVGSLAGILKASAGVVSANANTSDLPEAAGSLYYTDARARAAISTTATGLTYTSASGVLSLTSGYVIPTTTEESNWNSAYSASHTQNTDTGTSNNSWDIGDNTDNDKYLYAKNGDANKPGIKYNHTSNKWQYANDGITWSDMGSGGGTWGSITGTISSQTDLQTQFALYALLGGLAGGQLLKGGTGANENIQLQSTNHATRGYIESIDKHKFDTLAYFIEFDNGNSGTSKTIDWTANGNKQKITTTGSCTVTFTNPTGPCNLIIRIVHEASTTAYTYTWPATVKWPSGSSGKLATTNTSGSVDIVSFYFDGTNYNAQGAANFS